MTKIISGHPWIMVIFCVLTAGALAGAAVYLLTRFNREEQEEDGTIADVAELRKSFPTGRRMSRERWMLIYVSLSLHKMRSKHSQMEVGSLYEFIQRELVLRACQEPGGRIARFDGKNFLLLTRRNEADFTRMAEEFMQSLGRYAAREGIIHLPEICFGCYCMESSEVGFDEAARRAKEACKHAESTQKLVCVCDYEMLRNAEQVEELEKTIREAIAQDSFFLEFQPFVDGMTGEIVGGEVLSRLKSDDRGIVTPQLFLQAVAGVGIYGKFDYYIFEKCCAWASCRVEAKRKIKYFSCNFSRYTMSSVDFAERIMEIADRYGVPSRMVAVEVTEEEREAEIPALIRNLELLHQQGFTIFLDDFGKGFTSFADLQNYPIDVVKIDKDILDNAATEKGRIIFESMAQMAKRLGCTVLCEGVETEEQARLAKDAGCDLIQGFYYYRTLPADVFDSLLPVMEEQAH